MRKIVVVDDQKTVCYSIKRFLESKNFIVKTTCNPLEALKIIEDDKFDIAIIDVKMPNVNGIELLKLIKDKDNDIQVIMMTAFSATDKAIEAMKLGAYEYITKPFENDDLLKHINSALNVRKILESTISFSDGDDLELEEKLIGKSRSMLEIYKIIGKVAPTDATVLITGESGTGKELIARAIHKHSKRDTKPFLAINCAAIPENLLESELFGYEKGAFTGADHKKIGKFEQYNGGTIFLDEIGELALSIQSKLLRVLQDGSFQRIGSNETIKSNVRILAATNVPLENRVKEGLFREDLYYRLNVVRINVPPLRERKEDLKDLSLYFIKKYNRIYNLHFKGITKNTIEKFYEYDWRGNVRELENIIHKGMLLCDNDYLSIDNNLFNKENLNVKCLNTDKLIKELIETIFSENCSYKFQEIIERIETSIIKKSLEITKGNQVQAAKLLGISRNTLRKKAGLE
jgi:DNA-binding NtrC family response regulator